MTPKDESVQRVKPRRDMLKTLEKKNSSLTL